MSQIIAFQREDFGVIYADSNIVKSDNTRLAGDYRKVFKGKNFIIASAGLAYGIYIIEGLIKSSEMLAFTDIDFLENYLLTFGNTQYQNFIKANKNIKEDYMRIYFVIIGLKEDKKLSIKMIGAEGKDALKSFKVGNVVTIPRRITVELSLIKKMGNKEEDILSCIEKSLENIYKIDKSICPPYIFETIKI